MNPIKYPGSRWWKFDFHTHTPASTDTPWHPLIGLADELTAHAWLRKYMDAGIDCVAITDHNSGAWIDVLKAAYAEMQTSGAEGFRELHLFPGVEISVNGGFHLLAIFAKETTTSDIDSLLGGVNYRGTKGDSDGVTGKSPVEVVDAIQAAGGIAVPAHADDPKGVLRPKAVNPHCCELDANTVRQLLEHSGIQAMEVVNREFVPPDIYRESGTRWARVLGTDGHSFRGMNGRVPGSRFTWVKMGEPSLESLKLALQDGNEFSLIRSDEADSNQDPNGAPEEWIESLEISDARLMGRGWPATFEFSPRLNAVIGGRGSGKSTLVHFIRLVARREAELRNLGDGNRVQRNLESFKKIGQRRSDEGGLLEETQARLVYRKGEQRFRLTWLQSDGGTTVESFDRETDEWQPASSQDVVNRFPLGIFSQDEIGLIAENPGALLRRVDEAIGKADWEAKWENEINEFLGLIGKVRSQRARLGEKERLKGELEDVTKTLVVLEKSEHAATFKAARRVRRQKDQMDSLFEAYSRIVGEIDEVAENLLLHDLPADLIDPERPEERALGEVEANLRGAVVKAGRILEKVRHSMKSVATSGKLEIADSIWEAARKETETNYRALMEELEAKGLGDPAKFSQLAARRQVLEKNLKEIEAVERELEKLGKEAAESQKRLLDLRVELQAMRKDFLSRELGANQYVQIELNPFGAEQDSERVEAELREMLACEGTRFADALRNPEKSAGFVEDLYPEDAAAAPHLLLEKIESWKKQLVNAGKDRPTELSSSFHNFIKREIEKRPEFLDRVLAWWPEDSLSVSYSKGGKGRDFVSLRNGSAGEKAAALLAFFLAHGSNPLVIDQPENDLDNHLITDLVVNQLKQNKKRRQVIVVTHNPNIVVNGDAELVHAMCFDGGQCRAKASGPLQNAEVRAEVCEVMEGGKLALISRYQRLI